MTASLHRTVIVVVAALVLAVVLVVAATAGPGAMVGDLTSQQVQGSAPDAERVRPTKSSDPGPEHEVQRGAPADVTAWLQGLLDVVLVAAALWLLGLAVRSLLDRVARDHPEHLVLDAAVVARPPGSAGREALLRHADDLDEALDEGEPRNAVVACWLLLEQVAAEAGVRRGTSETATELVVRFLHALDVDPRPVARLARLFHEARFSSHELSPDARDTARAALDAIRRDLGPVGVR